MHEESVSPPRLPVLEGVCLPDDCDCFFYGNDGKRVKAVAVSTREIEGGKAKLVVLVMSPEKYNEELAFAKEEFQQRYGLGEIDDNTLAMVARVSSPYRIVDFVDILVVPTPGAFSVVVRTPAVQDLGSFFDTERCIAVYEVDPGKKKGTCFSGLAVKDGDHVIDVRESTNDIPVMGWRSLAVDLFYSVRQYDAERTQILVNCTASISRESVYALVRGPHGPEKIIKVRTGAAASVSPVVVNKDALSTLGEWEDLPLFLETEEAPIEVDRDMAIAAADDDAEMTDEDVEYDPFNDDDADRRALAHLVRDKPGDVDREALEEIGDLVAADDDDEE